MEKGFTLVELVIVIIIVGILSIVAVPIYKGYVRAAMVTEGKALLGSIANAEKVYYVQHGRCMDLPETSFNEELGVDARANKYFKTFSVVGTYHGNLAYQAYVFGDGNVARVLNGSYIVLQQSNSSEAPVITEYFID